MASLLVFALNPLGVFASPTPQSNSALSILKRANPTFGDISGFPNPDVNVIQIRDAFSDACTLAKAGRDAAVKDNKIFVKYFPETAAGNVQQVFKNIIGDDKTSGDPNDGNNPQDPEPCSKLLADITIRPDFEDEKEGLHCQEEAMAEMLDGDDENENPPTVIVCPAGLNHGGINKGYDIGHPTPGPKAVTCDTIGDRVTWMMDTLGAIMLHEYTHWIELVAPPLGQETVDVLQGTDIYGPIRAQQYAGLELAQTIADIYSWFAIEAFWSKECGKEYGRPQKGDDRDPNCNNEPCKDPGSNGGDATA